MSPDPSEIQVRLSRLERQNRWLTLFCCISLSVPLFAIVGWQTAKDAGQSSSDVLKVSRLEVVDSHGVPLVTLGADRASEGGMIMLRDKLGEKRTWWQAGPRTANLTFSSEDTQGENDTTLGFTVGPDLAKILLIGKSGSICLPRCETTDHIWTFGTKRVNRSLPPHGNRETSVTEANSIAHQENFIQ